MDLDVNAYYEKCRVIIAALEHAPESDREALMWMLEECFGKLGESLDKFIEKCLMR